MESEKDSNPYKDSLSLPAFAKAHGWLLGIAALTLGLSIPTISTWLAILAQRSLGDNTPQMLTGVFLVMALAKQSPVQWLRPQPSRTGLGLLALAGCLYLLGAWLSIKVVLFAGLLAILALLCWTLWGSALFYRCLPGFLFALFLLPQFPTDLRTAISLPLQMISTQWATGLASLLIPIKTLGNIFYIRGEAFEVTAACSGLNTWVGYLFAGMLAMLMGRFTGGRFFRLLVGPPVLALGENALRLWITALVAYWVSPQAGLAIHTNIEFLLFPLGLLVMVFAERQIEQRFPSVESLVESVTLPLTPPMRNPRPGVILGVMVLLGLINLGVWLPQAWGAATCQPWAALPSVPYQVGAWRGKDLPLLHDEVAILSPALITSREYYLDKVQQGQPIIWMNLLEASSMNALHNMVDSLIASGAKPQLMGTLTLATRKGPLKTSWFRCVDETGKPYHLLLWYEWQGGNAENRWAWYWNVLTLKLQQGEPTWRLVELAAPSSLTDTSAEQALKLEQLKAFAVELYPLTTPEVTHTPRCKKSRTS
jgi:exosortase